MTGLEENEMEGNYFILTCLVFFSLRSVFALPPQSRVELWCSTELHPHQPKPKEGGATKKRLVVCSFHQSVSLVREQGQPASTPKGYTLGKKDKDATKK